MLDNLLCDAAKEFKFQFDNFCLDRMLGENKGHLLVFQVEQNANAPSFPQRFFHEYCKTIAAISTASYQVKDVKYCISVRTVNEAVLNQISHKIEKI